MTDPGPESARSILALNDAFRRTFVGGVVTLTVGVTALASFVRRSILVKVRAFAEFNEDNDPHGEHDFGVVEVEDAKCFWKIDYYDADGETLSPNPADPAVTTRVLTVMLSDEY